MFLDLLALMLIWRKIEGRVDVSWFVATMPVWFPLAIKALLVWSALTRQEMMP